MIDDDEKRKTALKYKRVQARVRLAMLVTNSTLKGLLQLALMEIAPNVLDDIETVLKDLTDRDTNPRYRDGASA